MLIISAVIWLLFYVHHNFWQLQSARHQTNADFKADPPSAVLANTYSIMGSVICLCQCVHRAHADTDPTSVKCWVSAARPGQHTINTEQCILLDTYDYNVPCRPTYDTPTQCPLNAGPPSVMPVQPRNCIVTQRMSTRRKLCRFKAARVFSGIKKHWAFNPKAGLMLGKLRKQPPNIKLALHQHVG